MIESIEIKWLVFIVLLGLFIGSKFPLKRGYISMAAGLGGLAILLTFLINAVVSIIPIDGYCSFKDAAVLSCGGAGYAGVHLGYSLFISQAVVLVRLLVSGYSD